MPDPRPKACQQCRTAKARCDLTTPCSRCGKRGLDCQYRAAVRKRTREAPPQSLRLLRPATSGPLGQAEDEGNISTERPKVSSVTLENGDPKFALIGDHGTDVHDAVSRSIAEDAPLPAMDIPPDFMPEPFDLPEDIDISPFLFDFDMLATPDASDIHEEPQLEQRSRTFQQGALTAKLIFGKLASYCRLVADAVRLPPFIYPPCWATCIPRCHDGSPHRCLPEPLAICSNLTQMFYSRRDGTEGFVWQQICSHLKQLREKCEKSSDEGALQALQAAVIYGILCSTHVGLVSRSDADWVVSSIETLGRKAFDACAWALNSGHFCSSRKEWVLMESLRRIGSMLYLFDLLIQSTARTPSKGNCALFWFLPLPCQQALWRTLTDEDWSIRYRQDQETRKGNGWQGLTLRHLLLLRHANIAAESVGFEDELADWCEHADDLSTLLWMALTVEGDGQSLMAP